MNILKTALVVVFTQVSLSLTLLALLLSLSTTALASDIESKQRQSDEISIIFGGWSDHSVNSDTVLNETHNALGIKYKDFILTSFTNSYNNHSVVAAYSYDVIDYSVGNFAQELSLIGGLVTGYHENETGAAYLGGGVSLYFTPSLATTYKFNDTYSLTVDNGLIISSLGTVLTTTLRFNVKF